MIADPDCIKEKYAVLVCRLDEKDMPPESALKIMNREYIRRLLAGKGRVVGLSSADLAVELNEDSRRLNSVHPFL